VTFFSEQLQRPIIFQKKLIDTSGNFYLKLKENNDMAAQAFWAVVDSSRRQSKSPNS
jgi:hypothetical protein